MVWLRYVVWLRYAVWQCDYDTKLQTTQWLRARNEMVWYGALKLQH